MNLFSNLWIHAFDFCYFVSELSAAKAEEKVRVFCYLELNSTLLEIRVSQNLAKLGAGCTAGRNFGGVSICVWSFSPFHFVFFETKSVGRRSFPWFSYRLPSAIFVYHALPQAFPSSSSLSFVALLPGNRADIFNYIYITADSTVSAFWASSVQCWC